MTITWTREYEIELTPGELKEIRNQIRLYLHNHPTACFEELRSIVWSYIEDVYDDEIYMTFQEPQCDLVLNEVLKGFGIQYSMFNGGILVGYEG